MLIITADDYGKTVQATDCILECFRRRSITSASAMVFMADSERAAHLALNMDLEVGLHLNLTEVFTGLEVLDNLRRQQKKVSDYLNWNRYAHALFNPFLSHAFGRLIKLQLSEFERLYGRLPHFVNGHHHMHLCANVLGQHLLPKKTRMRRPFSLKTGEKSWINRWYRTLVAHHVEKVFITTDYFYSIEPIDDMDRLRMIVREAMAKNVEIEAHPEHFEQQQFLLSAQFKSLLEGVKLQGFRQIVG